MKTTTILSQPCLPSTPRHTPPMTVQAIDTLLEYLVEIGRAHV